MLAWCETQFRLLGRTRDAKSLALPALDRMAESAKDGVEFKMCNNAMKSGGFSTEEMHGFVTLVPAGSPEIGYYQGKG